MSNTLSGNLIDVNILDVLQLIMTSHSTGTLNIRGKKWNIKIFFKKGEPLNASSQCSEGFSALLDIALMKEGFFNFEKVHANAENKIEKSSQEVLIAISQAREKWENVLSKKLTANSIPELLETTNTNDIKLTKKEIVLIPHIDSNKSIYEIAKESKTSCFEVSEIIYNFIEKSLATIKSEKKENALPIKRTKLSVGLVHNILEGEDGVWMSRILGMAPHSMIEEFENEYVAWIDVDIVSQWEKTLKTTVDAVRMFTPRFEEVLIQISPQISLEDNLVLHEKLAKKLGLKEGDIVEVLPNFEGGE